MKRVIGIDPGTQVTGWGIIDMHDNRYILVDYGVIKTNPKTAQELRYLHIFEEIGLVIERHAPQVCAVETQYVDKNVQSAIKLGMARASSMLAAAQRGLPVFEYTPTKAKQAVTGNGQSTKDQVAYMIKILLGLQEVPKEQDATDALSLAIAHAHYARRPLCTNT